MPKTWYPVINYENCIGCGASFNMFVGNGVGTFVNGQILTHFDIGKIYISALILMLMVGMIASKMIKSKESRRMEA